MLCVIHRERGVQKTSIHLYRHSFSHYWIMSHGDIFRLQKILNHKTLSQTQHYANMWNADISDGFDEHNLLSNIAKPKEKIKLR